MAALTQPFNAMAHNPEMGVPSLPVGSKMPVVIRTSEIEASKGNSNNGMIVFGVEIIDGPNKGAIGAIRFNIYNQNSDAARIAADHLAALSYSVGVLNWQNTEQLHNLPFMIDVAKQKVPSGGEDKGYTEVVAYYDMNGNKPKRGQVPGNNGQQQQNNQQQNQQTNGGNAGGNGGNWNNGGNAGSDNGQNGQQNGGGNWNNNQNQNQQQGNSQQNQNNNGGGNWNQGNNQQQNGGNNGGNGGGAPWGQN